MRLEMTGAIKKKKKHVDKCLRSFKEGEITSSFGYQESKSSSRPGVDIDDYRLVIIAKMF